MNEYKAGVPWDAGLFRKDGGSLTVVFGAKGEDGRALTRPLLAAAAERLWGWTECP